MSKMKVHELAKELDKQSKDIISFLQEKGVEVKAAQSTVDDAAVDMVRKTLGKKGESQLVENKEVMEEPKKKKKIIFVSNPQNSKMPGQKSNQAQSGQKAVQKNNASATASQQQVQQPVRPIKPLTPPSPTPSVQMVPARTQNTKSFVPTKDKVVTEEVVKDIKKSETVVTETTSSVNSATADSNTNTRPQSNYNNQGNYNNNRPAGQGGYNNNRPAGQGGYNNNRPAGQGGYNSNRSEGQSGYNNRSEGQSGYNNNRPAGQGGYNNNRPAGQGGYNNNRPAGQGGYNNNRPAGQGGYNNNRPAGQGGYNSNRSEGQGGYNNNRPAGQGGYNNNRSEGQGGYNNNRPAGQGGYNNNRPAGQGGYNNNRPAGQGGYNNNRPAGQGGYNNNRPAGQGGYNNNRPTGQGGYNNRPGGGYNSSRAPYDKDADNNNRSYGRNGQGDKFGRGQQQSKGFGGDSAPIKDTEKHREEEKRRISQEKDKRNKKDIAYEQELELLKNKPGRFIKPEKKVEVVEEVIKVIVLPEMITIKELAEKMKLQPSAIVKKLFLEGKIVTVNQEVSYEDAENIAMEYDILCEKEVKVDVIEELLKEGDEEDENLIERPPVICVMGHVDHGKTSLLDAIRKTNVTDREAGGITQHIGAYTVSVGDRKITFLDTPGHEAFTAMRMRGANATDIAILVVAADDGVMPQTIEAINHAKAAGIEIIVAVNKIDKPSANMDKVKQELSEYELIPEDWGGSTVFAPVSAKKGEGIEQLLEMILLSADILELKANPDRQARGLVIEAELDKGRGPVATVLVQKGTLHVGDFISAGASHGKVRAMIDDKGRRVQEADPSTPVEILGLSDVPSAGEVFVAHENDKTAKTYAETYRAQNKVKMLEDTKAKMSLDDVFSQIKEGNLKELNLIVKADVQGSVEAVKQSLVKLNNEEVVVKCLHGGVGAINDSDVMLASASNAIIIGFNVRPDATAKITAEREGVDVRLYKVIYQAIEDVQAAMKGMLDPIYEEKVIGHAEVRQIFKASSIGNIAGSYVLDGIFQRGCKVRITREGKQIFEGQLESLKRFKDDVKEVKTGFECGLVFDGFDQMEEFDIVEAYIMVEVPR